MSMNQKLRAAVRTVILDVLDEAVSFENYEGENLEATCKHCGLDVWLVWDKNHPAKKWTECGDIGNGSCDGRYFGGNEPHDPDDDIEPAPPTMRSVAHDKVATKRSV